jgi:hypothetical protein
VRNSNAVALSALVLAAGGEPRYEGVATDNHAAPTGTTRCGSLDHHRRRLRRRARSRQKCAY